jgi:hypothetical protein
MKDENDSIRRFFKRNGFTTELLSDGKRVLLVSNIKRAKPPEAKLGDRFYLYHSLRFAILATVDGIGVMRSAFCITARFQRLSPSDFPVEKF